MSTEITPVALRGIECRFGRQAVLRGVDLELNPGEVVALLGANGSGKTTLFSILVGLRQPDRGTRTFAGKDAGEVTGEMRARLSWVAHAPQLYSLLTARENLELFAELWATMDSDSDSGKGSDPRALLRRLGLADVIDQPVGTFSRGMAQRVVLARALAQKPDLMVLDEPFTALDRQGRALLVTLLAEEAARGAAVLLSSHDVDQVAKVAHRVLLLEGGVIAATVSRKGDEDPQGPQFRERIASLFAAETLSVRQKETTMA